MSNQATEVKLVTGHGSNGWAFKFNGIPSTVVRSLLKARGWRWSPAESVWYGKADAELLDRVSKALDKEQGIRRPDAPCWSCGDPNGFFRPRGAAAPVWCDACNGREVTK